MTTVGNMFALLDDEDGPKPVARAPAAKADAPAKKPTKAPERSGAYPRDRDDRERCANARGASAREAGAHWCLLREITTSRIKHRVGLDCS